MSNHERNPPTQAMRLSFVRSVRLAFASTFVGVGAYHTGVAAHQNIVACDRQPQMTTTTERGVAIVTGGSRGIGAACCRQL